MKVCVFRYEKNLDDTYEEQVEEFEKFKKKYNVKYLSDGRPVLRYYPNEMTGKAKFGGAHTI